MNSFVSILVPGILHTGWFVSKVMTEGLVFGVCEYLVRRVSCDDDPIRWLVSERCTGLQ